jgi:hypothetical protein
MLQMRDNPEVVAGIMATLEPIRDELFEAARKDGRREPQGAYAADALAEVARRADGTGRGAKRSGQTKILARVDLSRLLGKRPVGDDVCEIAGYGPVAPSAIRDLLDSEDPFLAAVVTKGKKSSASPTSDGVPTPTSKARSSGCTRPAPQKAATAWRSWRTTTARPGRRPT